MESVRRADDGDLARICELARHARAELADQRGGVLLREREARAEPVEAALRELVGSPDGAVFAGLLDDAVVGYALVHVEPLGDGRALAVCDELYVEPDARTVAVGESLAAAVVAFARARGCIGVDAYALPGNRATKNFFEAHGFRARLLVMHRPLTPGER